MKLRFPSELMEKIRLAASSGRRTLSAEIIGRLERSFDPTLAVPVDAQKPDPFGIEMQIANLEDALMNEISMLADRIAALEQSKGLSSRDQCDS
jgi:hypothetical protein